MKVCFDVNDQEKVIYVLRPIKGIELITKSCFFQELHCIINLKKLKI